MASPTRSPGRSRCSPGRSTAPATSTTRSSAPAARPGPTRPPRPMLGARRLAEPERLSEPHRQLLLIERDRAQQHDDGDRQRRTGRRAAQRREQRHQPRPCRPPRLVRRPWASPSAAGWAGRPAVARRTPATAAWRRSSHRSCRRAEAAGRWFGGPSGGHDPDSADRRRTGASRSRLPARQPSPRCTRRLAESAYERHASTWPGHPPVVERADPQVSRDRAPPVAAGPRSPCAASSPRRRAAGSRR